MALKEKKCLKVKLALDMLFVSVFNLIEMIINNNQEKEKKFLLIIIR